MGVRQLFTTVPKPFAQFIYQTGTKAQGSKPFFHSKENTLRHFLEKTKQKTLVWGSKKSGDAFLSVRLNEDNFGLTFQSLTRGCLSVYVRTCFSSQMWLQNTSSLKTWEVKTWSEPTLFSLLFFHSIPDYVRALKGLWHSDHSTVRFTCQVWAL